MVKLQISGRCCLVLWHMSTTQYQLKNKRPTWCHLLFYFNYYVLNMFRTLIYPSSGACDYSVELPHWSYCSWFDVCWSFGVVGLEWYTCCRLQLATRIRMSETCWAHKKWNKLASDIKLVFYSSTITMTHGPINIRYTFCIQQFFFNPLNAELNPICHLLALSRAHHILHVSRTRVNTRHWIFRLALTAFCLMITLL